MIAPFVLVVNLLGIPGDWQYIGNFNSCEVAHQYMNMRFDEVFESKCMLEKYINLPENTERINLFPSFT
jgi:hypothetical protein